METIYLGQAPQLAKAEFLERLDREWQRVCQRYPAARRAGLSDGARDYEPWLAARTSWQILDFYHASGYLAGAAAGLRRKPAERAQWLEDACHALKHESRGGGARDKRRQGSGEPARPRVWRRNSPRRWRPAAARAARAQRWRRRADTLRIIKSA